MSLFAPYSPYRAALVYQRMLSRRSYFACDNLIFLIGCRDKSKCISPMLYVILMSLLPFLSGIALSEKVFQIESPYLFGASGIGLT